MGAASSVEFKTTEEALAAGKTREEIDAYLEANPVPAENADNAPAEVCVFDRSKIASDTEGRINAASPEVMEGDSDWRPCLSVQGGKKGVLKYVLRIEGHNGVAIGVAEPDCDVTKMIANEVHVRLSRFERANTCPQLTLLFR
jgi:hypothetical protein